MKNQKITPTNITKLKKNEVFVFGSNMNGNHAGGAARLAQDKFGAINGQAFGLQGKSFGIPTLNYDMSKIAMPDLARFVSKFIAFADTNRNLAFLVTEIGCGIAGFTHAEIAPLFKEAYGVHNIALPQSFVEILSTQKKGYKVTDSNMICNPDGKPFKFEIGKIHHVDGEIVPCLNGFHYCQELNDCFEYYDFNTNNRVFEIIDHGITKHEGDKSCTSDIEFVRELSWLEVYDLVNVGKGNTGRKNAGNYNAGNRNAGYSNAGNDNAGYSNAGNYNAGNRNAGNYNAGNRNAGYSNAGNSNAGNDNAGNYNAGNRNAGNRNAGYSNAGNRNAGYSNAGNRNAGNDNAGNDNAGDYNAGNRNAGYSNAGNDNAGAFNNLQANYIMFNKPSSWTYEDFTSSKAFGLLQSIDTTLYVPSGNMTDQEKKDHPYHITTGGYMKHLPYKECFTNAWNNWTTESREAFTSLPNFNWDVFTDITGVIES
ncbi:A1S_2505 family phage non-structural protein [Pedobacter punctiformis]|uniref:DUF7666 domain-containing protein n=1 Tax=Pedobacter punctiformis TaxID=3004097 RepID=A0ABT4LAP4_9SPHI|nr:hypothetical protein [Pedobacter sp. HCMS5-2]MCZ4244931.1 hypothetical protein [Pedobacter sp. HCMS5-2]